jgi:hypothetical protein
MEYTWHAAMKVVVHHTGKQTAVQAHEKLQALGCIIEPPLETGSALGDMQGEGPAAHPTTGVKSCAAAGCADQ